MQITLALAAAWEKKLVPFGLSSAQIGPKQNLHRRAIPVPERLGIQSYQFHDAAPGVWKRKAFRSYGMGDLAGMHRVRLAEYERGRLGWVPRIASQDSRKVATFVQNRSRGRSRVGGYPASDSESASLGSRLGIGRQLCP